MGTFSQSKETVLDILENMKSALRDRLLRIKDVRPHQDPISTGLREEASADRRSPSYVTALPSPSVSGRLPLRLNSRHPSLKVDVDFSAREASDRGEVDPGSLLAPRRVSHSRPESSLLGPQPSQFPPLPLLHSCTPLQRFKSAARNVVLSRPGIITPWTTLTVTFQVNRSRDVMQAALLLTPPP